MLTRRTLGKAGVALVGDRRKAVGLRGLPTATRGMPVLLFAGPIADWRCLPEDLSMEPRLKNGEAMLPPRRGVYLP